MQLERILRGKLHKARSGSADNRTKVRIFYLSIYRCWPVELGVVEDVERLDAKFKVSCIGKANIFPECHIKVIDSRAVEDSAFGIAKLAQCLFAEKRGIEGWTAISPIGIDLERARRVLRGVEKIVVCSVAQGADE